MNFRRVSGAASVVVVIIAFGMGCSQVTIQLDGIYIPVSTTPQDVSISPSLSRVGIQAAPVTFTANIPDTAYYWSTSPVISGIDGAKTPSVTLDPSVLVESMQYEILLMEKIRGTWHSTSLIFSAVHGDVSE